MPRRLERKPLVHHLKVLNRNTRRLFGYLGNITVEGVMLFCPQPVRADVVFPFEMLLPAEVDGNRSVFFEADSVWCRKDDQLGLYAAGFRIRHIAPRNRKLIADAIEAFGSRS